MFGYLGGSILVGFLILVTTNKALGTENPSTMAPNGGWPYVVVTTCISMALITLGSGCTLHTLVFGRRADCPESMPVDPPLLLLLLTQSAPIVMYPAGILARRHLQMRLLWGPTGARR